MCVFFSAAEGREGVELLDAVVLDHRAAGAAGESWDGTLRACETEGDRGGGYGLPRPLSPLSIPPSLCRRLLSAVVITLNGIGSYAAPSCIRVSFCRFLSITYQVATYSSLASTINSSLSISLLRG